MYVNLHPRFNNSSEGERAAQLTSACVHCGFCLETCPTYLDSRDERDSPRGRIYLIKQMLETGGAGEATRTHLDRCLTCRNCETTCPSGMRYGELLDIGRGLIESEAPRTMPARLLRTMLRTVLARPALLAPFFALGRLARPLLPDVLQRRIPIALVTDNIPVNIHTRRMIILEGCVQKAATPGTNAATRRVLDRLGISLVDAPQAGCCGALNYHLAAHEAGLENMRRNIDAWWPLIENGAEAIISSASGCGVTLRDYGQLLANDAQYAERARRVSAMARDLGEIVAAEDLTALVTGERPGPVAVHTPCTLQHGQGLPGLLEDILQRSGFELAPTRDDHLCCGSAGTYSVLQPARARRLGARKAAALNSGQPAVIATANIGCQMHLGVVAQVPVVHWIELLDTGHAGGQAGS